MNEVKELLEMSLYAGGRFDLVQAGGGNTSVKTDKGEMYIKSSGYLLSEMNEIKGYSIVDNYGVLEIFNNEVLVNTIGKREKDAIANELMGQKLISGDRPSIETFLHALLYKYTLHVHSIAVNIISSAINWKERLEELYPTALFIEYKTPGIELAVEMRTKLDVYMSKYGVKPQMVFLQNHGLIVSSDDYSDIEMMTESILDKIESLHNLDFKKYRNTTEISRLVSEITNATQIAYLSEDIVINKVLKESKRLFYNLPFCPDGLVYCGYSAIEFNGKDDQKVLEEYYSTYHETPKVIIYEEYVYLLAQDLKKAKYIEDVLKNNLIILENCSDSIVNLTNSELAYLGNWEAEQYRQNK